MLPKRLVALQRFVPGPHPTMVVESGIDLSILASDRGAGLLQGPTKPIYEGVEAFRTELNKKLEIADDRDDFLVLSGKA